MNLTAIGRRDDAVSNRLIESKWTSNGQDPLAALDFVAIRKLSRG